MVRNQRLKRLVAPRLGAYKLDQTYLGLSAWMRITGFSLSGVAYIYFLGYLVAPIFSGSLDTATLISGFYGLLMLAKASFKTLIAFPFAFYLLNGVK